MKKYAAKKNLSPCKLEHFKVDNLEIGNFYYLQ